MTAKYTSKTTGEEVATDLASQIKNKVILTTGVSPNSLGAHFLTVIATHQPRLLILAGRNLSKVQETAKTIASLALGVETRVVQLDLADQKQIRKAADEVLGYQEAIDVLVLNAGIMAPPYATTVDGIESQFGSNHIGHFLFANLVMPKLLANPAGGRVVSVSSLGYKMGPVRFEDLGFHGGEVYQPWLAYGQSKTANMLLAVSLAEKLEKKGVVAVSVHPGAINTNLADHLEGNLMPLIETNRMVGNAMGWIEWSPDYFKSLSEGIATHVVAAFDPNLKDFNGRYFEDSNAVPLEEVRCWARDPVEAERLWKVSEELVGQKFEY